MMTIRRMTRANRRGLVSHFLALDIEDRRLRFGNPLSDDAVRAYVEHLDFKCGGVFAYVDSRRRIVGVAHVAVTTTDAEIGLSVLPRGRGQGLGTHLFERAAAFACERGAQRINMHYLAENRAMQHIAVKAGMRIESYSGESDAYLAVPPERLQQMEREFLSQNVPMNEPGVSSTDHATIFTPDH
jgi:RimJ/RimL family protein N-acetyltransferase